VSISGGLFFAFSALQRCFWDIHAKFFWLGKLKCIGNVLFLYLQMYLFWYREGQAGAIEMLHNYPRILRRNVTTSGQFCICFHVDE